MTYFACYPRGDKTKVTVIDVQYADEMHEWSVAHPNDFYVRDEAIEFTRQFAETHGLTYVLFESRYDNEKNEYLGEFGLSIDQPLTTITDDNLELMLAKVPEKEWGRMFKDVKEGKIDNVGSIRLRLYRMLRGDFSK